MANLTTSRSLIGHIHHGSLIEGEPEKIRRTLLEFFASEWGIKAKANPDFSDQTFATLSIGDARSLKERQGRRTFDSGKKIFLIQAEAVTIEAQNSLLKIFEEPTEQTYFFLFGGCVSNLIPTLVSRLNKISLAELSAVKTENGLAEKFIASGLSERLAFAKKLSAEIADEKKTKADALAFLNAMEKIFYDKAKKEKGAFPEKLFADLEMCRKYMTDRSASVKMLLEYVALVVPMTK